MSYLHGDHAFRVQLICVQKLFAGTENRMCHYHQRQGGERKGSKSCLLLGTPFILLSGRKTQTTQVCSAPTVMAQ